MQESSHCSVCGRDWLLLLWVCVGISILASRGAFSVALFSQLPHDRTGPEWQNHVATTLARLHCWHICLLLDRFRVVLFVCTGKPRI